jgi:hypothetical protein
MINTSITHSHQFSAIIVSNETVESMSNQRDKIIRIADKFVDEEHSYLDENDLETYVSKTNRDLGSQRSHFKIRNEKKESV